MPTRTFCWAPTQFHFKGGGSGVDHSLLIVALCLFHVLLYICLCHLHGENDAGWFTLSFWCLVIVNILLIFLTELDSLLCLSGVLLLLLFCGSS